MTRTADPFDLIGSAQHLTINGAGKPPSRELMITMLFHPQVVTLTGLLAGRQWQHRTLADGHVGWLVEQITARDILAGYVPENREDPLIKWVHGYVLMRRFAAHYRNAAIYDVFYPHEALGPPSSDP